ncbi:symmetrical bis(5'-nucleosyl)-tetraphosphatase [Verticiella sediminum]|uniref:Bis(5'-nucleosyl)-tetraphosphatase, symmetrical n=1 Tax=Verticiella sediminum TaxID=1247510 RepID=A0A556ALP2_9BURK|nr:symmetrical bis(5'-nucleosyl)-tetraphosphatase [Verticiella sediminum]TSH93814.1 symmetrical bis(5'-nucleosyl)-tetraphosphatase [Verticiella sediminum]
MNPVWAIGDIQGCCQALDRLLSLPVVAADADRKFWFAGDLVNRGPQSLAALRLVMSLGERAVTVLGNHDLHLLAAAAGKRKLRKSDTLAEILDAPDAAEILDWVRHRPLAHAEDGYLLVHAGVLPSWTVDQTLARAAEVEAVLRGRNWQDFLGSMYGDEPDAWSDKLRGADRLRVIVNALTRMRFCSADGRMEFATKGEAAAPPAGYMPWFEAPERLTRDTTVVFGHWSTLGLRMTDGVIALDTGCVWGGKLTAVRLADRKIAQIECAGLPGMRQPEE